MAHLKTQWIKKLYARVTSRFCLQQEQALHAVHSVVMLVDKDTCQRPEKQPGLQVRNVQVSGRVQIPVPV